MSIEVEALARSWALLIDIFLPTEFGRESPYFAIRLSILQLFSYPVLTLVLGI